MLLYWLSAIYALINVFNIEGIDRCFLPEFHADLSRCKKNFVLSVMEKTPPFCHQFAPFWPRASEF